MRKLKKKYRLVAVLLLCCILISTLSMGVFAAPDASSSDGIGMSMYDVSTALTAYANNVVGSNTNDKHDTHMLSELGFGIDFKRHPGTAGAFIGYGDEDKGFYPYISSNTARSVTTSSYDAWLTVGDGDNIYTYARYGHLLADLGLDETGNAAGSATGRNVFGLFMQGSHAVSAFVPKVFDTSLSILKALNPFQFFAGTVTIKNPDGSSTSTNTDVKDAITGGSMSEGTTTKDGAGNTVTLDGDSSLNARQTIGTSPAFTKLIDYISDIYGAALSIGIWVVIPMSIVILLCALLFKRDSTGIKPFLVKLVFIAVGVPLCGVCYTAVLTNMTTVTQKSPAASKMVACTFIDFQSWVQQSRLDIPSGISLESAGMKTSNGDSVTAAGSASVDTIKQLRNITYELNKKVYNFDITFGLGINSSTTTNPGMWNSSGLRSNNSSATLEKQMNAMLQRYRSGDFYHASTWETAVNGAISKNHRSDLGQIPSTANATTNEGKIYQMYDETNEVSDWMNRDITDNRNILNGTKWSAFNIFSNGGLKAETSSMFGLISQTVKLTFTGSGNVWVDKADPSTKGGLSSVAMYNYLSTSFDDSSISVYSAQKSTSEYTKKAHYSVNLIGSGALKWAYAINCIACLFAFALIGIVYGFGMMIGNIKRGISLIMQIPFAVMGVIRSIIQTVIYVSVMCIELIFSVFAYKWVCELIVLFASIIESPIETAVSNASIVLGGRFAFIADYVSPIVFADNRILFTVGIFLMALAVVILNHKVIKYSRCVMTVYEYVMCKYLRFLAFDEMKPVFDAWMAKRESLYVWDSVFETVDVVSETVHDVVTVDLELKEKGELA